MATHDYVIANASGAAVRQDINNALAAIVSNNSSATEPATTYAFQFWFDTTNNILKLRNAANSAWIDWITTTATVLLPDGAVGTPSLTFASETDTGLYRIAANTLGIATSGTERVEISDTGIIVNEGGAAAIDVRIEGDGDANLVFCDAGNDRLGVGTSSPAQKLHIFEATNGDVGIRIENNEGYAELEVDADELNYNADTHVFNNQADSAERMRLDSSGRLHVGTSSNIGGGTIVGATAAGAGLVLGRNDTSVQAGEEIGKIQFWGNDSNGTYQQCAGITAEADLNHATSDKPTRLVFSVTADGASSPTERLFLLSNGRLGVGISSPDFTLDVNGGVGITEGQALQWHNGSGTNSAQIYGDSSDNLVFRNTSSNTERLRILAGGGITFNGDTAAANALDDYEEGTWTPVLAGGTSAGTYTYGAQAGFYTKIGRKVYVTATLNNIATSSEGSGELQVTGLPFAAGTGSSNIGQVFLDNFDFSNVAGTLCSIIAPSESFLTIREVVDDGSDTTMSVTDRNSSSSDLVINCTYIV